MSSNTHDRADGAASSVERPEEPRPLAGLTGFQRDLLFVIARTEEERPNGVRINEELEAHYGGTINNGRLYQNLRELVDEELVATRPLDGRTNAYRLTPLARERLDAFREWARRCLCEREGDG